MLALNRNSLATAGAFPLNKQGHSKTILSADETVPASFRFRAVLNQHCFRVFISEVFVVNFLTAPVLTRFPGFLNNTVGGFGALHESNWK
jgi:hypothetical protein